MTIPSPAKIITSRLWRLHHPEKLLSLKPAKRVIAIGNFDGVHRGHQALVRQAVARASALGVRASAMVFEPQPREFFARINTTASSAPARLMRLEEKLRALDAYGIEDFFVQQFTVEFSNCSPSTFADLLVKLGACEVIVGEDFRYGHRASGNIDLLARDGEARGFCVSAMANVLHDGERVSSSRIRAALSAGDVQQAAVLLGHPVQFWGRVGHGDKMGGRLGFPTLNLVHKRAVLPLRGVYSAWVSREHETQRYPAVCNIGVRPTVDGLAPRIEAHLLGAQGDWYGQKISITIVAKVRDEQKFDGLEALKVQIGKDIAIARVQLEGGVAI